ncbi:MAG: hypothetical protein WBX10_19570, partial [Candidatus Sulfotelmatobacter sp.]
GRSPTIAFPGAVKMFTLSVFDSGLVDPTGAVARVVSFGPFLLAIDTLSIASEKQILIEPAA